MLLVISACTRQSSVPTVHIEGCIRFKFISLVNTGTSPNRTNIDHAIAVFHKRATLLGQFDAGNIRKTEVDDILVSFLAQPLNEAITGQWLAQTNGSQSILGKTEIEKARNIDGRGTDLLLLLDQIGASHEANRAPVAQLGKELEHFGGDGLLS